MKFELRPARPADVEAIMQVMADATYFSTLDTKTTHSTWLERTE